MIHFIVPELRGSANRHQPARSAQFNPHKYCGIIILGGSRPISSLTVGIAGQVVYGSAPQPQTTESTDPD